MKEWHDCLTMLGEAKVDEDGNVISQKDSNMMNLDKESDDHEINVGKFFMFRRKLDLSYDRSVWFVKRDCLHQTRNA